MTEPPTHEVLTGKFVWGDLFTSDVELSRAFYERLFGWQWRVVSAPPRSYGMLYAEGVPVAGIVHRAPTTGTAGYGRWVHYVSVEDVAAAQQLTRRRGGRILLTRQQIAERIILIGRRLAIDRPGQELAVRCELERRIVVPVLDALDMALGQRGRVGPRCAGHPTGRGRDPGPGGPGVRSRRRWRPG